MPFGGTLFNPLQAVSSSDAESKPCFLIPENPWMSLWQDVRKHQMCASSLPLHFSYEKLNNLPQATLLRAAELSLESGPHSPALSDYIFFHCSPRGGKHTSDSVPPMFLPGMIRLTPASSNAIMLLWNAHAVMPDECHIFPRTCIAMDFNPILNTAFGHRILMDDTESSSVFRSSASLRASEWTWEKFALNLGMATEGKRERPPSHHSMSTLTIRYR